MLVSQKNTQWHPGNIYTLICALRGLGMGCHATIYSLFLREIGVKQDQISALNSLFWLTLILAELPTGMLADGKSRSWSVKAGFLITSFSLASYGFAQGFWSALVSEMLIGVAMAFLSGAEQAWLADALDKIGRSDDLKKVYARSTAWSSIAALAGGVLSDYLAQMFNYRVGWFLGGAMVFLGFLAAVKYMGNQGEPQERLTELQALKASIKALKVSPSLLWAVAAAMSLGFINPFNHFWSQFFNGRLNGGSLGWVWVIIYGSCALAGVVVRRVSFTQGREVGSMLFLILQISVSYMFIAKMPGVWWPMLLVVMHEIGRGAYFPLVDVFIQRRVESGYRATYGSLHSFLGRMGNTVILAGVWLTNRGLPDGENKILNIWSVTGQMLLVSLFLLWLLRPRSESQSEVRSSTPAA